MPRHELSPLEKKIRTSISENLKKYSSGLTQAQLSDLTGIPASTISGYFAKRSTPNAGTIQKLADALNVNKSDIDPRFKQDEILSEKDSINSKIIDDTVKIMSNLNDLYQKRVYSYAKEQYENQSLAFPDTLAAHQADPNHIISDAEAKNISEGLRKIAEDHKNK